MIVKTEGANMLQSQVRMIVKTEEANILLVSLIVNTGGVRVYQRPSRLQHGSALPGFHNNIFLRPANNWKR